jgi:hypothetical protein
MADNLQLWLDVTGWRLNKVCLSVTKTLNVDVSTAVEYIWAAFQLTVEKKRIVITVS